MYVLKLFCHISRMGRRVLSNYCIQFQTHNCQLYQLKSDLWKKTTDQLSKFIQTIKKKNCSTSCSPRMCLISMGFSLSWFFKNFSNCDPQSTKVWNMTFIFPEVNVGVNLVRKFLHLAPPMENKWAAVELNNSKFYSQYVNIFFFTFNLVKNKIRFCQCSMLKNFNGYFHKMDISFNLFQYLYSTLPHRYFSTCSNTVKL